MVKKASIVGSGSKVRVPVLIVDAGVPNLEALHDRRYGKDADYQAWKASTSALIPWFPRGPKSPAD